MRNGTRPRSPSFQLTSPASRIRGLARRKGRRAQLVENAADIELARLVRPGPVAEKKSVHSMCAVYPRLGIE